MRYLVIILFTILNAHAENFRVGDVTTEWQVEKASVEYHDQISVLHQKKKVFEYKAKLVTQKLLQFGLVRFHNKKIPHLVTVWSGGAHGQELIIFDLVKAQKSEEAIAYL